MHTGKTENEEFSSEEVKTICSSALFQGFVRSEIAGLLTQFDVRRTVCRDGEVLADESVPPTRMGVLLSGFLHIYDSAHKGQRHLVRIVRPGQILGASLVGVRKTMYPALVTAHGACVIATLSLAAVGKCVESGGGPLYRSLALCVHEELQASWRKIALMSCPNIAERVMLYLQDRSRLEGAKTFSIGSTEAEFADYLGVHRTALARTLRKLAEEGHIKYRRDVFTVCG